jgi:plastocyanin
VRCLLFLLPAALALAACGGSSTKSDQAGAVAQTIRISEQEYSLTPSTATFSKPGTYEFNVTNKGQMTHALEIEGNGVEEKTGAIQPGSSATLRVTLSKDGSYEMYCPVDGHKHQGMKGAVTVGTGGESGGTTTETGPTTTTSPGY